jgi:hypothetical protein
MNSQKTLKAVVESSSNFEEFAWMLPNFLDEFYAHPHGSVIEEEPPLVGGKFERGKVVDAYVAATAAALAHRAGFRPPKWVYQEARISEPPFFVRPAGRTYLRVKVPCTPGKGKC